MHGGRRIGFAAVALAATFAASFAAAVTPPEFSHLIGAKAAGGDTLMRSRDFTFVRTEKVGRFSYTYWSKGSLCLEVATKNGRYATIREVDACFPPVLVPPAPKRSRH